MKADRLDIIVLPTISNHPWLALTLGVALFSLLLLIYIDYKWRV